MMVPLILLLLSLAGVAWAVLLPGLADLLLLAVPCALASLFLLLRSARGRVARAPRWVVIDGSNVMHWQDGTPRIATVRAVVDHLKAQGYSPGVVFDANAGHLTSGRYQHDGALAAQLGLPADRVMVVGKGTQADPVLLAAARDLGARIVSNDRFRDWAGTHPEVREPGHLIRGHFHAGALVLELERSGS
ncbi:hypothetical protein GEU84_000990 [Fertoebacter nigrum]|uniref:RNase NYN domain-containing protein n=1 Tax=Fertoeibacter niger TaxID=2656921 RepID=A0A8X8GYR9_9RHOB|nr:hypothetical protein [Fertoeibacter niger]NUB42947.1 hypothetical protein [Fertoeibacter niger]